jgi:hypothetical protein
MYEYKMNPSLNDDFETPKENYNNPLGLYTVAHGKNETKDYIRGASHQFDLDEKKVKQLLLTQRQEIVEIVDGMTIDLSEGVDAKFIAGFNYALFKLSERIEKGA